MAAMASPPPPPTPLPRLPMVCCFMTQLSFAVFVTMPFTTFVYMVQDLYPGRSETFLAARTGLLASLSNLSMFVTSVPWGLASDRRGRRPVLLVGACSAALTMFALGCARSYGFACFARVLGGLLNGSLGTMKAVIADVTDASNAPRAFAGLSVAWGLGAVAGPAIGGLLSRPCVLGGGLYDTVFCAPGGLLTSRPYFMPCLVSSLLCAASGVLAWRLQETLGMQGKAPVQHRANPEGCTHENAPLLGDEVELREQTGERREHGESEAFPVVQEAIPSPAPPVRWFRDQQCVLCLLGYGLCAFIFIQLDELLPLFAAAPVASGGLGLTPKGLSAPLAWNGMVVFLFTLLAYPPLVARWGLRFATRGGYWATAGATLAVPVASLAAPPVSTVLLYAAVSARGAAAVTVFTSSMILVNRGAPLGQLGEVNGAGQALAALVRGVGPAIAGLEWGSSVRSSVAGAQFAAFVSVAATALLGVALYGRVRFEEEEQEARTPTAQHNGSPSE